MSLSIVAREHRPLEQNESFDKIEKHLSENSAAIWTKKVLGLHFSKRGICPGNYIGAVWVGSGDERVRLYVNSKFESPTMDYMKMFATCCADPDIGERMRDCFEVWPNEEFIESPKGIDFSFIVVVAFLRELNTLCVRHLRRHFERRRENLTGRVKGKIVINENLRRNIGHAERVFCEYQSISNDILENRILRAALEKAAKYLSMYQYQARKYSVMQRWVYACRAHLQGVSVVNISRRDFGAARQRGAFAPYRRPLHLAKAVLSHFGFSPLEEWNEIIETPPYCIDSAKLFEYYAELRLRRKYPNILVQNAAENKTGGFAVEVRPDFCLPKQNGEPPKIIDAKYKHLYRERPSGSDLYQMIAYSQHRGLLQEINGSTADIENADAPELCLVYPRLKNMLWPEEDFTEAFKIKISVRGIPCPTVKSIPDRSDTQEE